MLKGRPDNSVNDLSIQNSVKPLKIRTHKKFDVIILKFEQGDYRRVMCPKDTEGIANSEDPDQSDL